MRRWGDRSSPSGAGLEPRALRPWVIPSRLHAVFASIPQALTDPAAPPGYRAAEQLSHRAANSPLASYNRSCAMASEAADGKPRWVKHFGVHYRIRSPFMRGNNSLNKKVASPWLKQRSAWLRLGNRRDATPGQAATRIANTSGIRKSFVVTSPPPPVRNAGQTASPRLLKSASFPR